MLPFEDNELPKFCHTLYEAECAFLGPNLCHSDCKAKTFNNLRVW